MIQIFAGAWYAVQDLEIEDTEQSLGPDELRSFTKKEAIVNGGGAWLLPYVYMPDMIPNHTEIGTR